MYEREGIQIKARGVQETLQCCAVADMATVGAVGSGRMQWIAMSTYTTSVARPPSAASVTVGGISSATTLRSNILGNRGMSSSAANLLRTTNSRNSASRVVCAQAEPKEAVAVGEEREIETPPVAPVEKEWGKSEPRRYHVRPGQLFNVLSSSLSLPLRFGSGALMKGYKISLVPAADFPPDRYASFEIAGRKVVETGSAGPRPEKPIELYEFEGCPFCRKVREIVSTLDLDVLYYPTPKNGPNFRPKAVKMGGKKQFPYMVDPNTGVSMYESDDIIKYLVEKYGDGKVPLALSLGPITTLTAGLAMIGRVGKGSTYTPSKLPEKPLQVWSYEPSPFCKLVREKLVELELPHYYYSTPRGSEKRNELFQRVGHFQVPYLEDPNTGVKMFESADIVEYLEQTYAVPASA